MEVDLKKSLDASSTQRRVIYGFASTPDEDVERETILSQGLDVSYFRDFGFFNYDHDHGPHAIVGYPYPDEVRIDASGFYVAGELFKGVPYADSLWNLIQVMSRSKAPRSLSFSIEGKVLERDGPVLKRALVTEVAITPRPVNPKATLHAVLKSFSAQKALEAGYEVNPQSMQGGGALRVESVDGAVHLMRYCYTQKEEILRRLAQKENLDFYEALLFTFLTNPHLDKLHEVYQHGGVLI